MRNGHVSMVGKRYLLQAVIGVFFCSLATTAASEPTLQETLDFIERKTAGMCQISAFVDNDSTTHVIRTGDYAITLLDDDMTLIESQYRHRRDLGGRDDQMGYPGYLQDTMTIRVKIRLADLSTHVKIATAESHTNIFGECTKKDCIEYQPTNVQTEYDYIFEGKIRQRTGQEYDRQKQLFSSLALFQVCSPDSAERIQKALTHAIKLSGGKDELF